MFLLKKSNIEFEIINKKFRNNMVELLKSVNKKAAKQFHKKSKSIYFNQDERVFLIRFKGDILISNMNEVKEQINALLSVASEGDTCLFSIESGGGTVTSYGELAYELSRIRGMGIKLITVVDQVAASGGYMLAVQGDEVYAAPNAVLGSIGVIVSMPNYKKALDKIGINFNNYMAGKNKRPITPYTEPTEDGVNKLNEDLGKVHKMFKEMVSARRQGIDIDLVSEGDTFFGEEALSLKMIDGIKSSNEMIFDYVKKSIIVVEIKYKNKEMRGLSYKIAASLFHEIDKRFLSSLSKRWY